MKNGQLMKSLVSLTGLTRIRIRTGIRYERRGDYIQPMQLDLAIAGLQTVVVVVDAAINSSMQQPP